MWSHRSISWDRQERTVLCSSAKTTEPGVLKVKSRREALQLWNRKSKTPPSPYASSPRGTQLTGAVHIENRPSLAKDRVWREGIRGSVEFQTQAVKFYFVLSLRIIFGSTLCPLGPVLSIPVYWTWKSRKPSNPGSLPMPPWEICI